MRTRITKPKYIALAVVLVVLGIFLVSLWNTPVECRANNEGQQPALNAENSKAFEKIKADLKDYAHAEESTYLTFPEWYIVYSAQEYAGFLQNKPASQFPYFAAAAQYWRSYACVHELTKSRYEFSGGNHLMLVVIGTSFSVEYAIKGSYENTVGRFTEWLSGGQAVEEDMVAQKVAREYGDFLHHTPWYDFPFGSKLIKLWQETSLWGPGVIRKWERKIALSLEYSGKAVYGWLIKMATETTYAPYDSEMMIWMETIPNPVLQQEPRIRVIQQVDDTSVLIAIPRFDAFKDVIMLLARNDLQFIEIASNDEIMVTAIALRDWQYNLQEGEVVFAMEILTQPELKRIAVKAPVKSLHRVLTGLESSGVKIEHIYDY